MILSMVMNNMSYTISLLAVAFAADGDCVADEGEPPASDAEVESEAMLLDEMAIDTKTPATSTRKTSGVA